MWQIRFYPELSLLPSDAERRILIGQASKRAFSLGLRFIAGAAAMVITVLGVFRLAELARMWLPGLLVVLMVMVFNIALGLFGWYVIWHAPFRRELRRGLIARGFPICLHCGYDLTGLSEPRCPECGQPFGPIADVG